MCRWAAYAGEPIFLEDVVSRPGHSLVAQSLGAAQAPTPTNGDGFGLAWYDIRPEPGLYRDIYPAWSDPNLRSICKQVRSGLFLAHVRASTGTATSRNNCHPFAVGRWCFMHNGQVGGFEAFRKHADMLVPDELYAHRKGATDSEALFLLALAEGLDAEPVAALERAVGRLETLSRRHGQGPHMRLSAAYSDGRALYAVRYASDEAAPSLYFRYSESRNGFAVVSEPLELNESGWRVVPAGQLVRFARDGSMESRTFRPAPS